jgi:hypothetical protein
MSQSDDQGRPEASPYGQGSGTGPGTGPGSGAAEQPYGQPETDERYGRPASGQPYGQPQYGQPQHGQSPYGQPQHGQPQYGQPQHGQSPYGQPQYGQSYGEQQYGQQQYGNPGAYGGQYGQQAGYPQQYGQYGMSAVPARPGGVTTAAIFGFIFGALGALVTVFLIVVGAALAGGSPSDLDDLLPGLGSQVGAAVGIAFAFALLALAWTVITIWGSVHALTGRSRVLLLVAGSIAIVATGFTFFAGLGDETTTAGGVIFVLILFAMSIAIVVLLALRPATQFYAAHRARRGR